LHVTPAFDAGEIGWRTGGMLAGADGLRIVVHGRQTHAAYPWKGLDPIVIASQIVLGLQTIASRQLDITEAPALITIGKIEGGVRENIIPDDVVMLGTIRYLGPGMQKDIQERIKRTATGIAESAGAKAEVTITERVALTFNDPALTAKMLPSLRRTAGDANVKEAQPSLGSEDFSYYQKEIPGLFIWLGIKTPGADPALFAANHSPRFRVDESGLKLGVRALSRLTVDYMQAPAGPHHPSPLLPASPHPPGKEGVVSLKKEERKALLALTAAAFTFRFALLLLPRVMRWDEPVYLLLGRNLWSRLGFSFSGHPELHHSPLFPLLVGATLKLTGRPEAASDIWYVLLGALLTLPVYGLARRLIGHRGAFLAAALVAFFPALTTAVLYWGTMIEPLFLILLYTAAYVVAKGVDAESPWLFTVAGVLTGLAFLARPEGILWMVSLEGAALLVWALRRRLKERRALAALAVLPLGFLAVASPQLLFLHGHTGRWMISGKVGITYEIGPRGRIRGPGALRRDRQHARRRRRDPRRLRIPLPARRGGERRK